MTRICIIILLLFVAGITICKAEWDYSYEGNALPSSPINTTAEVTHNSPDDIREIISPDILHIVDTSVNRTRYIVDLAELYGTGAQAGIIETRQRFAASSDMNNIAVMMRQDTAGASAEIRVGYYDAGDGRKGLWNAKNGEFLGPIDPAQYYKIRMVLDNASGGRLYVNDSYFANLVAAPGASSRLAFGAGSTLGTGEVYVDYFRWKHGIAAGPGEANDPASPETLMSPRVLTLPSASPALDSVTITWTTDVPTTSTVRWGTTWACSNSTHNDALVTNHSMQINGLTPGTNYKFYVESGSGTSTARSGISSFTTLDTFRICSEIFLKLSSDGKSVGVSWYTTKSSDGRFLYRVKGTTGWSSAYFPEHTTFHSVVAKNLTPNTTYEYYVQSIRPGSPDAQSPIMEFYTYVYPSADSYLVNGNFELGNTVGWNTATGTGSALVRTGPWMDHIMPHCGDYFLSSQAQSSSTNSVMYQYVSGLPAENLEYYATAWIHTYEVDQFGVEEHNSAFCQIGIDFIQQEPSIDPNASTIVWSAPLNTMNSAPWSLIGVKAQSNGYSHAIVFLRQINNADGGTSATAFDDVVLTTAANPISITSGPTVSNITSTTATIQWTTNIASTTFVQYGQGTLGNYRLTECYQNSTPTTDHTMTIGLMPGLSYVFQVGSVAQTNLVLSSQMAFSTPINDELENTSFEAIDPLGRHTLAPWTLFQYDINMIPRLYYPGQPTGGPIDGLIGPYPSDGTTWHGVKCEPGNGSYFLGAYSNGTNKNGGVYQKVKVIPGKTYIASMRFLTQQNPIDSSHPAEYTACAIAIDPTGGTNVTSTSLVWSTDKASTIDGQWDTVSTWAKATSEYITVFCIIEQRMTDMVHLNAIDNVTLQILDETWHSGKVKTQPLGIPVSVDNAIVTCVKFPLEFGMPIKIYVEEPDRSAGIAIQTTDFMLWFDPLNPGDRISANGTLTIVDTNGNPAEQGEVVITVNDFSSTIGSPSDAPKPLVLSNRNLGGAAFGIQQGVYGGTGLSNVGMLVKVYGEVVSGDTTSGWITDANGYTCAYIDDGSHVQSGVSTPGVKIVYDMRNELIPLAKGSKIEVVGISSVEFIDGALRPVVYIRSPEEIGPY